MKIIRSIFCLLEKEDSITDQMSGDSIQTLISALSPYGSFIVEGCDISSFTFDVDSIRVVYERKYYNLISK